MRTIGQGSIASLLNVVLGFVRLGVALLLFLAAAMTATSFVVRPDALAVAVPVSFSLDVPMPIHVGRTGFGFDLVGGRDEPKRAQTGRIDRVEGSLRISPDDRRVLVANAVAFLLVTVFTLFVIDELRAVLKTLIQGSPFVASNATHIRRIGLAVIVGELVRTAVVFAENYYATTHVAIAGVQFDAWPSVSLSTIGCGLIILVIAEVFRIGTRLDEEQSLTV
jgi:hypothetical protein